jgi:8-oxo-dGTP diphosphatase
MLRVTFHDLPEIDESKVLFVVIMARHGGSWLFVRKKGWNTWEIPGGHRELGETVAEAAARELYEETGASPAELMPLCAYSVTSDKAETHGVLFFAEADTLGPLPESEIAEVKGLVAMPEELTYPDIQPRLYAKALEFLALRENGKHDSGGGRNVNA